MNPAVPDFDCSCFDGRYVTGDVSPAYLNFIEGQRKAAKEAKKKAEKEAEKEE